MIPPCRAAMLRWCLLPSFLKSQTCFKPQQDWGAPGSDGLNQYEVASLTQVIVHLWKPTGTQSSACAMHVAGHHQLVWWLHSGPRTVFVLSPRAAQCTTHSSSLVKRIPRHTGKEHCWCISCSPWGKPMTKPGAQSVFESEELGIKAN